MYLSVTPCSCKTKYQFTNNISVLYVLNIALL